MDAMTTPEDPISKLKEGAVVLHEIFMSYVSAGFTRAEALELAKSVLMTSIALGQKGNSDA